MTQAISASSVPRLPGHLGATPRLSRWLRIRSDGTVEVTPGKVEIGQGILTALVQIVADELDVGLDRVRLVNANTARSPNEAVTAGSLSVQDCGMALRHVCAGGARHLSGCRGRAAGRGRWHAGGTRRHDRGTWQSAYQLLGELADDALLAGMRARASAPSLSRHGS
jgi:CO/xanthine dehydrogenase Mo-binding subunit